MPGSSPVLVEKLGLFSNKELDLDFACSCGCLPGDAGTGEFSNSVPSVADRTEQTNSTPLPNATVIKKTTVFFLYRITLQNTKLESA